MKSLQKPSFTVHWFRLWKKFFHRGLGRTCCFCAILSINVYSTTNIFPLFFQFGKQRKITYSRRFYIILKMLIIIMQEECGASHLYHWKFLEFAGSAVYKKNCYSIKSYLVWWKQQHLSHEQRRQIVSSNALYLTSKHQRHLYRTYFPYSHPTSGLRCIRQWCDYVT